MLKADRISCTDPDGCNEDHQALAQRRRNIHDGHASRKVKTREKGLWKGERLPDMKNRISTWLIYRISIRIKPRELHRAADHSLCDSERR